MRKLTIAAGLVHCYEPTLDEQGSPRKGELDEELGTGGTFTLEQYAKHARDPEFAKAADPAEHQAALDAYADELARQVAAEEAGKAAELERQTRELAKVGGRVLG